MDYRTLGRSGLKVSPLCLGTDNFANPTPEDECASMIEAALDAGINFIDTSDSYVKGECERIIGRTLAKNKRRHEAVIATKIFYPTGPGPNDRGGSRRHILQACENSLRRLQTDHIDLYQTHRPSFDCPIEETLEALTYLIGQGKILYIGSSTSPAWKVLEAVLTSENKGYARFISEQPPYNLLDRRIENEIVPMCREHGLGLIPWGVLGMGVLAGRYPDGRSFPEDSRAALRGGIYAERVTEKGVQVGRQFARIAHDLGVSPAQLAVVWAKEQPGITAPIIGPRTVEQFRHLLPTIEMTLDESVRKACDELVPPGSAVANFHNSAPWMKMKLLS
ncbi:MAG: aldo/keto reductase [Candidatus Aminicenantales bacterium]